MGKNPSNKNRKTLACLQKVFTGLPKRGYQGGQTFIVALFFFFCSSNHVIFHLLNCSHQQQQKNCMPLYVIIEPFSLVSPQRQKTWTEKWSIETNKQIFSPADFPLHCLTLSQSNTTFPQSVNPDSAAGQSIQLFGGGYFLVHNQQQ